MGRKNSSNISEPIEDDEEETTIEEQVENAIKELPTLEEKISAIAINGYLIEKRGLDKKLEADVTKIEVNDRKLYEKYLTEIYDIVSGKVDLTDEDFQGVKDLLTDQENESKHNYYPKKELEEYWLKVLQSSEEVGQIIQPDDDPLLKNLVNITASRTEDGSNLTVVFYFKQNQWFSNEAIKKQFEMDGDTIKRSYGDAVEWKQGKNITVEIVKKKNKKKKTTTTKKIKKQSFFNIFNEIDLSSDHEDNEEEAGEDENKEVEDLEKQYEVCNAIYEQLLPRSLEHYLGLASFGDIGDMGDLNAPIEEDEEEEEEQKPKKQKKKRKASQSSKE